MNVNHKLELLDQLDDAAFALMMDEYSEAEGERLRAEFEADMRAGLTPPKPEGLDEKCRKQIKAEYGRARRAEYGVRARKMAVKAAAMVLIGIGIAAATVMSVEALRIPALNFFVEYFDGRISFNSNIDQGMPKEDPCMMLADLLPDDYTQIDYSSDVDLVYTMYQNNQGETVTLSIFAPGMAIDVDTEDAEYSEVDIADYRAILLNKNGWNVIWGDDDGATYIFRSSALPKNQVLELCCTLATAP